MKRQRTYHHHHRALKGNITKKTHTTMGCDRMPHPIVKNNPYIYNVGKLYYGRKTLPSFTENEADVSGVRYVRTSRLSVHTMLEPLNETV